MGTGRYIVNYRQQERRETMNDKSIEEQVNRMSIYQLYDWVDDMEAVLAAMPVEAREAYLKAHRSLVVKAMKEASS